MCAQRPKASRRRSGSVIAAKGRGSVACSTPEGIETKISNRLAHRGVNRLAVLNARRHRDEDQVGSYFGRTGLWECSTPEGIETKIRPDRSRQPSAPRRVLNARRHRDEDQCFFVSVTSFSRSGAQRPKASRRRSDADRRSSSRRFVPWVLNARRHRDEDQAAVPDGQGRA